MPRPVMTKQLYKLLAPFLDSLAYLKFSHYNNKIVNKVYTLQKMYDLLLVTGGIVLFAEF